MGFLFFLHQQSIDYLSRTWPVIRGVPGQRACPLSAAYPRGAVKRGPIGTYAYKLQQKVLLNLPLKHYTHNVKYHFCQKKLSCKVQSEKGLVPAALFPPS